MAGGFRYRDGFFQREEVDGWFAAIDPPAGYDRKEFRGAWGDPFLEITARPDQIRIELIYDVESGHMRVFENAGEVFAARFDRFEAIGEDARRRLRELLAPEVLEQLAALY